MANGGMSFSSITQTSATINGYYKWGYETNLSPSKSHKVEFWFNVSSTNGYNKTYTDSEYLAAGLTSHTFNGHVNVTGLTPGNDYDVHLEVMLFTDGVQGNHYNYYNSFTTKTASKPTAGTISISNITETSAYVSVSGNSAGSGASIASEVLGCNGQSIYNDYGTFTGLSPGRSYTVEYYIENNYGYAATTSKSFTTREETYIQASVTTPTISSITETSAVASWTMDLGNAAIYQTGTYWKLVNAATGAEVKKQNYSTEGRNTATLTGLSPGTRYTFTAYAENMKTSGVSRSASFTTDEKVSLPASISGLTYSGLTETSVTVSWRMSLNGSSIYQKNTYYVLTNNETGEEILKENYSTEGLNTKSLTRLQPGTQYKFTVYAENMATSGVSDYITFTTLGRKPYAISVTGLQVVSLTDENLSFGFTVTAADPAGISADSFYSITEKSTGTEVKKLNFIGSGEMLFNVPIDGNFKELTAYVITVKAINKSDTNSSTQTTEFTTLEGNFMVLIDESGNKKVPAYLITESGVKALKKGDFKIITESEV